MPQINPQRVLSDLRTLATFGAYKTGVHRPTLSKEDIAAREWFVARMREAGLDASIDGIANIFGKSPAPGRKALSGSHLESQNHAGWLDGPLGCVYALEAARAIAEDPATRNLGVDVVVFCDEEGHFGSFLGSRSFIGALEESEIDAASNRATGLSMRDGARGRRLVRPPAPSDRYVALCGVLRGAHRTGRYAGERRPQDRRRHRHRRHLAVQVHRAGRAEPRRHHVHGAPARCRTRAGAAARRHRRALPRHLRPAHGVDHGAHRARSRREEHHPGQGRGPVPAARRRPRRARSAGGGDPRGCPARQRRPAAASWRSSGSAPARPP